MSCRWGHRLEPRVKVGVASDANVRMGMLRDCLVENGLALGTNNLNSGVGGDSSHVVGAVNHEQRLEEARGAYKEGLH